jgi:hypothetical protein
MPISLDIEAIWDINLDNLDENFREAINEKFSQLVNQLYDKVVENVSGKILQKQSGELAGQIVQEIDVETEVLFGFVGVNPESPKAFALEYGGKNYYTILPDKAKVLHWFRNGEHNFRKKVLHPPSKEYRYLRQAGDEMAPIISKEMNEAVVAAFAASKK